MENKSWTVTYRNRDNGQRITAAVFAEDQQQAREKAQADDQIGSHDVWEVEAIEPHEETLARILIAKFAKKQQGGHFACPRCGKMTMDTECVTRNALSRRVGCYICDTCGTVEALEDFTHIERPDDPAYANAYFINANSATAPGIVDADRNPVLARSEVYSGVYGRASINLYAFNSNGNKGIACGLNNLQLIRAGEPLGGKASAETDFATDDDDDFLA